MSKDRGPGDHVVESDAKSDGSPPEGPEPGRKPVNGKRTSLAKKGLLADEALAFQPDAVEIELKKVPTAARWAIYLIIALFASSIAWASVSEVDRIVRGSGKLVPTVSPVVVQPLALSVIRRIHVKSGDVVEKGQVLVTLDPTFSEADLFQTEGAIRSVSAEIDRLQAEFDGETYAPASRDTDDADELLQASLYAARQAEYAARLRSLNETTAQLKAAAVTNRREQSMLKARMETLSQMVAMRKELFDKTHGSRIEYLDAMDRHQELIVDLERAKNRQQEIGHQLKNSQSELESFRTNWRNQIGARLSEAIRERDGLAQQLAKARRVNDLVVLRAAADAVVHEVQDKSTGAVVQQAETLMTLVRLDAPLEAEIELPTRDIGWVKPGDGIRLKLEAFPFQRYGTLSGRLRVITPDVVDSDITSQAGVRQPVYRTRIEITENNLRGIPDNVRLSPGMAVTADIKVGQRRVISYFMDPLLKGLDESIKEPR